MVQLPFAFPSQTEVAQSLAADHYGLVKAVARQTKRRLPAYFDVQELIGAGTLGLMDAAKRFNPMLGIPFVPFARRRILGAIMDYIRRADEANRQHRRDTRAHRDPLPCFKVQLEWHDGPLNVPGQEPAPDAATALAHRRRLLALCLAELPARHRKIITRYYLHGGTQRSLCRELNICDSRVSQLHAEALDLLRAVVQRRGLTAEAF